MNLMLEKEATGFARSVITELDCAGKNGVSGI
jgi:hypothetical protein